MPPRIAIVHEHLHAPGGSEKVLEVMLECFPTADLHALTYAPQFYKGSIIADRSIRTSFLQRVPSGHRSRLWLPLLPAAVRCLDLRGYDLVLSSNHLVAKGYSKPPGQLHLCYIHTPMRAAWDLHDFYLSASADTGWLYRQIAPPILRRLREWDRRTASGVDHFIANSTAVADRVRRYYDRQATVIHPPVNLGRFRPGGNREAYYLVVSRLVQNKRVELAVRACNIAGVPLVVIGQGPQLQRLRALAGADTTFLGHLDDEQVATHMQRCRAFLVPGKEDFGIATAEAQAAGAPVLAFGQGGSRDIVEDGVTGLFFEPQEAEALAARICDFERLHPQFDPTTIAQSAKRFDTTIFKTALLAEVNRRWSQHQAAGDGQSTT